jgi:hypothetical protein
MFGYLRALSGLLLGYSLAFSAVEIPITATIDLDRLIACIEHKEGAPWSNAGGALQFTRATWSDFSTDPYTWASQPDKARQIARKALLRAIQRMRQDGIKPSVWLLALRWNCGYAGMVKRMEGRWDYAEHVRNLYYDHDFLRTRL